MKNRLGRALGLAALAALGFGALALAATAHIPPWGFDLAGRDTSISPGGDFYGYANGTYVKNLVIPPDRSRYGSFDALQATSEERMHDILEKAAHDTDASGEEAKLGAFYRAFLDEGRANALGAKPLAHAFARIRAARTRADLARLMGEGALGFYGSAFSPAIEVDAKDPDHYAVYLSQGGLGLPDRDYYLEPSFAAQKSAYEAYIAKMLVLAKWPNAAAEARNIVALETKIAGASWSIAEDRDPVAGYNPMTTVELSRLAPGFDWAAFLQGAELSGVGRVVVGEKSAFPKIAAIVGATPVETLQAWQAFDLVDAAAPYLSQPFVETRFEFRSKTLGGAKELRPRWKRAVSQVDLDMGEALGRKYVAAYFPPAAKDAALALIGNIRVALAERIKRLDWMSEATKAKALQKLSMLTIKVGYPSKWRDYGALRISDTDLVGDVDRSAAFDWRRQVKRLNGPVDRTEWGITPQTINAYYNATMNEIVFPAAILQAPFFDPAADPAINYGAIGGIMGHEMTHGFDDQGRHFDGTGRLTDWWTAEDDAKFRERAARLGAQYSAIEPLPGTHIKGDQTMGENIADLGGSLLALDAYRASLGGQPAPVLDGLTGEQRVFLGWAQIWRSSIRPDTLRRLLVSDVHSPDPARVNGVVRNNDGWYDAWGIKPGDALYLAPDQRVRIW
jgi:putative endopeptidase